MGLSPWRRAHSSYKFPTVTSARRPWPSGSRRFKPADAQRPSKTHHQRPNPTPSLHASGAMKPAAAGAMKKPTKKDGGRLVFKMGLSPEPSLSFAILKLEISNSYKDGRRLVFKMGPGRGGGRGGPIAVLAQASWWLGTLAAPPGQPSALTWDPVGPRRPCRPLQGSQTRWCCWPCASVPGPTSPPRRADASFQYKPQDGLQEGALYGTCTIAEDRLRLTWCSYVICCCHP